MRSGRLRPGFTVPTALAITVLGALGGCAGAPSEPDAAADAPNDTRRVCDLGRLLCTRDYAVDAGPVEPECDLIVCDFHECPPGCRVFS